MNAPTRELSRMIRTILDALAEALEASTLDIPQALANDPLKHVDPIHKAITKWVYEQKRLPGTSQADFDVAGYAALIYLHLFATCCRMTPATLPVSKIIELQSITHQAIKNLAKTFPTSRKDSNNENQASLPF